MEMLSSFRGSSMSSVLLSLSLSMFAVAQALTSLIQFVIACTSGRCNRQSEFTLLHFTIFH